MNKDLGALPAVYPMPVLEVAADDENGKMDPGKLNAPVFDPSRNGYYVCGERAGKAWSAGAALMKKD